MNSWITPKNGRAQKKLSRRQGTASFENWLWTGYSTNILWVNASPLIFTV